jgi:hypothetical protein
MSEATDVVDAQITAFRDRDLERFLGFYSANAAIRDYDGNVLMGAAAMRAQYGQLFRDSPQLSVQVPQRMTVGEYVIDEELVEGFNLPGFPPSLHTVVVYRVTDGKIQGAVFLS